MTFRNFREFNLAMFGKQGWKLINKPESLTTKLLKTIYYKNREFLLAQLGYKPRFVWCSVYGVHNRYYKMGVDGGSGMVEV